MTLKFFYILLKKQSPSQLSAKIRLSLKTGFRCEDILICIETGNYSLDCCGQFFDPEPYYSWSGLCFVSKQIQLSSHLLMSYETIKVGVNLSHVLPSGVFLILRDNSCIRSRGRLPGKAILTFIVETSGMATFI